MKKVKLAVVLLAAAMFAMGCATARTPVNGFLYVDVKAPLSVAAGSDPKTGEACASSILGLVATGDASIEAAKKAGGISEVAYIDFTSSRILGIYAKFCTVVKGR